VTAGQDAAARTVITADLLRERRRGGSANVDLMHVFVSRLREDEIGHAASYFASLPDVRDPPPTSR
jgi:hypothetical protein